MGEGFYSEQFAKAQVQAQANTGRVDNLGHFSVEKASCFNFTQDMTDSNVVIPAVQQALSDKGGNVADQITANETFLTNLAFAVLIIPPFLGCSDWTVSGDALKVGPVAESDPPKSVQQGEVGK
jgi:hypothetical protein